MATLEISKKNVLNAYDKADKSQQSLLINLFGEDLFNRKITDVIKTFEDALDKSELTQEQFDEMYGTSPQSQAFGKLEVIAKALNEGWKPNWGNSSEYKYYPWFKLQGGFSFHRFDFYCTRSGVGSRLCFKSRELAEYAGNQFLSIYKTYMTID